MILRLRKILFHTIPSIVSLNRRHQTIAMHELMMRMTMMMTCITTQKRLHRRLRYNTHQQHNIQMIQAFAWVRHHLYRDIHNLSMNIADVTTQTV